MGVIMIDFNGKKYECPVEMTVDLIGGKWKVLILWHLSEGTLRFNSLKRFFPDITQKMLTQQLRDMEANGLVDRKVYAQVPPRVEYSLTPLGKSIMPVIYSMNSWGTEFMKKLQNSNS